MEVSGILHWFHSICNRKRRRGGQSGNPRRSSVHGSALQNVGEHRRIAMLLGRDIGKVGAFHMHGTDVPVHF